MFNVCLSILYTFRCAQNSEFMFNNVIGVNTVGSCGAHSGANSNASHVVPKAQALEIIRLVLLSAISSQELASLGADEFRAVLEKGVEVACVFCCITENKFILIFLNHLHEVSKV